MPTRKVSELPPVPGSWLDELIRGLAVGLGAAEPQSRAEKILATVPWLLPALGTLYMTNNPGLAQKVLEEALREYKQHPPLVSPFGTGGQMFPVRTEFGRGPTHHAIVHILEKPGTAKPEATAAHEVTHTLQKIIAPYWVPRGLIHEPGAERVGLYTVLEEASAWAPAIRAGLYSPEEAARAGFGSYLEALLGTISRGQKSKREDVRMTSAAALDILKKWWEPRAGGQSIEVLFKSAPPAFDEMAGAPILAQVAENPSILERWFSDVSYAFRKLPQGGYIEGLGGMLRAITEAAQAPIKFAHEAAHLGRALKELPSLLFKLGPQDLSVLSGKPISTITEELLKPQRPLQPWLVSLLQKTLLRGL
jgi:hypothetical protein